MRRITEEEASPRCDQLFSPLPLEGKAEDLGTPSVSNRESSMVDHTLRPQNGSRPRIQVTILSNGPSNPTVTAVSRTEVIVSWEPPGQFLLTRLRCYEVYINASTKPTYSGTQTFCHLRGLKPNCQYLFKVQMVLKSKAVTDKATLNSKGGASRHYSENLQPPSSMHRRRRQAHDRPHVNGKIHPQTDKRDLLGLTASGHSIHKAVQAEELTPFSLPRLEGRSRNSRRCLTVTASSHLMKASLIGTTVVRITRGGKRPRPHRVAPIAACNSPDGSAYQQSLLLDKAATHPTTDSKSSRADQPERLLSCTQLVLMACRKKWIYFEMLLGKNELSAQLSTSTAFLLGCGGGIVGTAELQSCISHALKRSNRHMAFYPFLLNNRKKGFSFRIPN
ncbi:hypothetical protein ECG_02197 [Echinococcus granulosus]|nr:hypothetical protein ECG_02197 [Echinococcus granulosus]